MVCALSQGVKVILEKTNLCGQVALEYALAMVVVAGLCSMLFLFYQSFVFKNLYGSSGEATTVMKQVRGNPLGLHKAVSLPTP